MDLLMDMASTVGGLVLLIGGAHYLVEGAVGLARRFGVSSLVVGLTVVAFGTSAPELAASVMCVLRERSDLAVGTVVGSNIANIGLVLAVSALISPLACSLRVIRYEVPVMIAVGALGALLMADGRVVRWEGLVLVGLLVAYTWLGYASGRRAGARERRVEEELEREVGAARDRAVWALVVLVGASLGAVSSGADLLVGGATGLAEAAGVSPFLIGVFLVAVSTSLPELATGVIAARRRQPDIVLGNVLGSNVFNILCVLGVSSQVGRLEVPAGAVRVDLWVMVGFSAACVPVVFSGARITRWEAAGLMGAYLAYAVGSFAL